MKKSIPSWQIAGFVFTAITGTFLHFLFDLTGGSVWSALFSAVNESIWEHMKLLYYPMVIVAVAEYFLWGKEYDSFWCIKLMGILVGIAVIPVIYYTYTGILGISADWFNITIFFIAAGLVYWLETKLFQKDFTCRFPPALSVIIMIAVTFIVLTFVPPQIPLFQDPISGTYGF